MLNHDKTPDTLKLFDEFYANFQKHSQKFGFKDSLRQESIFKVLFFANHYLSAENILQTVRNEYHVKISLPSVYKLLSYLEEIHFVTSLIIYSEKTKKYKLTLSMHYDQLVCTHCGKVIHFHNAEVEKLQNDILDAHAFLGLGHTMVLYGLCEECKHANTHR